MRVVDLKWLEYDSDVDIAEIPGGVVFRCREFPHGYSVYGGGSNKNNFWRAGERYRCYGICDELLLQGAIYYVIEEYEKKSLAAEVGYDTVT